MADDDAPAAGPATLERVTLTVADLDCGTAFYRDRFEMRVVAQASAVELGPLFGVERAAADISWLRGDQSPVAIELVHFPDHPAPPRRSRDANWANGLFSLAFRFRDQQAAHAALAAAGHDFLSAPVAFAASFAGGRAVRDVELVCPDGGIISLIEYCDEPFPVAGRTIGEFIDVGQWVPDLDGAIGWYRDVLGLPLLNRERMPTGLVDELLALPAGSNVDIAFLGDPARSPLIELLAIDAPAPALPQGPYPTGQTALAFHVVALASAVAAGVARGAREIGRARRRLADGNAVESVMLATPGGAMVELYAPFEEAE